MSSGRFPGAIDSEAVQLARLDLKARANPQIRRDSLQGHSACFVIRVCRVEQAKLDRRSGRGSEAETGFFAVPDGTGNRVQGAFTSLHAGGPIDSVSRRPARTVILRSCAAVASSAISG